MLMNGKNSLNRTDEEVAEDIRAKHAIRCAALNSVANSPSQELSPHGEAVKHDQGKVPYDLLPTSALHGVAEVLGFGAKKYAPNNWRKGMGWSRLVGAALRHLTAWNDGEDKDPESNLSHLKHAACCIAFLIEYEEKKLGKDDRFKRP